MSNEQLRRAQEEEEDVVSLGQEPESEEELELSDSEAEEELGSTPLITACRKGMTEVCCECMREREGVLHIVVYDPPTKTVQRQYIQC